METGSAAESDSIEAIAGPSERPHPDVVRTIAAVSPHTATKPCRTRSRIKCEVDRSVEGVENCVRMGRMIETNGKSVNTNGNAIYGHRQFQIGVPRSRSFDVAVPGGGG